MKPSFIECKSLSSQKKILSFFENFLRFSNFWEVSKTYTLQYMLLYRMGNLHQFIGKEFMREIVLELHKWEHLEKKIVDYGNHCGFTIRCLDKDLTPVSLKPKASMRIYKHRYIIHKAERKLMNECVRIISNSIELCALKKDRWIEHLASILGVKVLFTYHPRTKIQEPRKPQVHKTTLVSSATGTFVENNICLQIWWSHIT